MSKVFFACFVISFRKNGYKGLDFSPDLIVIRKITYGSVYMYQSNAGDFEVWLCRPIQCPTELNFIKKKMLPMVRIYRVHLILKTCHVHFIFAFPNVFVCVRKGAGCSPEYPG